MRILMPFLLFFGRRILGGFVAKTVANFFIRRFNLSAGVASLLFVVVTELLARSSEKAVPDAQVKAASKRAKK